MRHGERNVCSPAMSSRRQQRFGLQAKSSGRPGARSAPGGNGTGARGRRRPPPRVPRRRFRCRIRARRELPPPRCGCRSRRDGSGLRYGCHRRRASPRPTRSVPGDAHRAAAAGCPPRDGSCRRRLLRLRRLRLRRLRRAAASCPPPCGRTRGRYRRIEGQRGCRWTPLYPPPFPRSRKDMPVPDILILDHLVVFTTFSGNGSHIPPCFPGSSRSRAGRRHHPRVSQADRP